MKRLFTFSLLLFTFTAFAAPFSAALTATGKNGETEGCPDRYAAYLCTAADALTYFGGNTAYDTVTAWLTDNYAIGIAALESGKAAMLPYGEDGRSFDEGEYSFTKYFQDGLSGGYLAVAAYAGDAETLFRAFDGTADGEGALTLDPDFGAGSAGDWTAAPGSVPEPTSGLLLLLGAAGLALRRRRA